MSSELKNFFDRLKNGDRLTVAYLGGSITWGATASDPLKTSYRALVTRWMEETFPSAHIKSVDAAIGGTPSKLGVFRMDRDVLPFTPDLTFVEFAVNDGADKPVPDTMETMEGILGKLHRANPAMAIVMIIIGSGWDYGSNTRPLHIALAEHYGIAYIDVAGEVMKRVASGLDTKRILTDGCHPSDDGYRLYADIITGVLTEKFRARNDEKAFPAPMTQNRYEHARMIELSTLLPHEGWTPASPSLIGTWFDHQPSRWFSSTISPVTDGSRLAIDLVTGGIGLYYEIVRGGGDIVISSDGEEVLRVSTAMSLHYARVAFSFVLFDNVLRRTIALIAPKKENVKIAYLLCCGS